MVLHTQRCPGGSGSPFQQQNYLTYQETGGRIHDGGYTNFSVTTGHLTPYSNYSQQQQSGWSTGGGYHGNGASHYSESSHNRSNSFGYGHNGYGNGLNCGHGPNGTNYGYQTTSWTTKNLDEE